MNSLDFSLFDKLNTPVMVTDSKGVIIYKNTGAAAIIKGPRIGVCIYNYLNKESNRSINHRSFRIEAFKNSKLSFNKAFVFRHEENEVWLFSLMLQLMEPGDIDLIPSSSMCNIYEMTSKFISQELQGSGYSANMRYSRILAPLVDSFHELDHACPHDDSFDIIRLIPELKRLTYSLAKRYFFRTELRAERLERLFIYEASYRNISASFFQALLILLKITSFAPTDISVTQENEDFHFNFMARLSEPLSPLPPLSHTLEELAKIYPCESSNILCFEAFTQASGYKTEWFIEESNGYPVIRLSFTVTAEKKLELRSPSLKNELIVSHISERIEKLFASILESLNNA